MSSSNNIKRCSRCGLGENTHGINLNSKDLCNYCSDWIPKENKVNFNTVDAANIIQNLVKSQYSQVTTNGKRPKHDVIVLYSGGKDSTYMLARLKRDIGLRPLAVTVDNWFLSSKSMEKQTEVLGALGVDHITIRPSLDSILELFKISANKVNEKEFEKFYSKYGIFCWPCFSLIYSSVCSLAKNSGIRLIAGGWSPGQINAGKHTSRNDGLISFSEVIKIYVEPFHQMILKVGSNSEIDLPVPQDGEGISLLPFFNYWPYDEAEIIKYITDEFNWDKPKDTDGCSSNCLINLLDRIIYRKRFGFDRYELQLANMVRSGHLTRQAVLDIANERLDADSVKKIAYDLELDKIISTQGSESNVC
ncbi:hypothetical protein [Wukongibacter sp. M2B1]|uniref:hypothetical protein n=1 Tax=Wukongibacter sp. M2B1 TaxID=3088895 RepID=UPI003D7B22E9